MDTDTIERHLVVAEWDGELAVRLPADIAGRLDLKAGDTLRLVEIAGGGLKFERADPRESALARMAKRSWETPPGYRFDREDANTR